MMGRAGRPQFDETGVACIFVAEDKKTFYKKFLHEPFPVESSLHLQLHDHLSAEIATGSLHCTRDCIEYLTWTYYFRRLMMNPAYYGLLPHTSGSSTTAAAATGDSKGGKSTVPAVPGSNELSVAAVEAHLTKLVNTVTSDLTAAGLIEMEKVTEVGTLVENNSFSATYLGKIASLYYLQYKTVGMLRKRLYDLDDEDRVAATQGMFENNDKKKHRYQMWQLLLVLCDAPEFSELPVRHCEDELNQQLAEELSVQLRDSISDKGSLFQFISQRSSFDSPHAKAFLLLLARMESAPLPITDFINDTKTVLDQVARVLKAMVDIAGEEGLFDIVLRLAQISQLIVQVIILLKLAC
jgi:replicative superfamily II helicase